MRGTLVNAEEDEAARRRTERLQEVQHGVSPAIQARRMLHSVAAWLFGFILTIWGVLGAVVAWLPQLQVTEHEEATGASDVEIDETVVNDESTAVNEGGKDIGDGEHVLEPRQKVFLSHSGAQKDFVEQLCVDLQRWDRYPFFDKLRSSLPIGERFPKRIFDAIEQCPVGVVVLSEEFFMSKWPMLELHAMVKKYKESKSRMTIIPVFYLISVDDMKDSKKRKQWISKWKELAGKDKRIDVEEWIECIRILESIHGLVMEEGMGDVKFREEIVKEVCGKIPCETRWDDSRVQGRLRICEVIQAKMMEVDTTSRVSVVGLYGVGGIGKTTICKALCNELSPKFGDFVCHIELGSGSELEMLQKALKKLTNMEHDVVNKLDDVGQGYAYLNKRLVTQRVFLALDNVQDNNNSLRMTESFLRARYGLGSVVLVSGRSLDVLKMVYLKESQCLEMPELEEDEARSLFLDYTNISARGHDVDEALVKHCLRRCHFLKGDVENRHYHPLALEVLGQQFGRDSRFWEAQLMKIDSFNQLGDMEHPVFCIFRNSFDSLNREQQLVFMDLALRRNNGNDDDTVHRLCLLHQERKEDMKDMLEVLKRKSMLDELSDDFTRIGMHDLWREFAVVETKTQDLRDQRWVYQVDEGRGALGRSRLCRESVERMYFRNWGWKGLDGLKLDEFVNVTSLKLYVEIFMVDEKLDLDLSGLKQLKVLQVECPGLAVICNGLSSLRSLYQLVWCSPGISPCFNEIGCLTNLQYLGLSDVKGVEVLDFTGLDLLSCVVLVNLPDLVTVRGFSSRMANLRMLAIVSCMSLQECPGLGEVYSLATIRLIDCGVTVIPDLARLSNLRILNIIRCKSLKAVPGFGGLISLEEFNADGCENLVTVPDMGRLTKLQCLNTVLCPMQGLRDLDGLISLTELCASFGEIEGEQPLFSNLSALKVACIIGWNGSNLWTSIQNLPMLEFLSLEDCRGDDVVPDLQSVKRLKRVIIIKCDVRDLSGLSNVTALEVLHVLRCDRLERLPEFERPTKLIELRINGCNSLVDWPSASNLCSLVSLKVDSVSLTKIMPNLEKLTSLQDLMLCGEGCEIVLSGAFLSQLETLEVDGSPRMQSLDLSNYLRLRVLVLLGCSGLERVTCRTPLGALVDVDVRRCEHLVELPDLSMFPELEEVSVRNCSALRNLTCSRPLTALEDMTLIGCGSLLGESVDVRKFPKLRRFRRVDSDTMTDAGTLMAVYEEEVRQFRRFPARSVMSHKYGVYGRK